MQKNEKPQLSVVIPFYNEEECVEFVCNEVYDVLSSSIDIPWELIMVNDESTDNTPDMINSLAQKHDFFRAIHLSPHGGQSAALEAGIQASQGNIIGTLDGDGQNDPRDLRILLDEMEKRQVDMMCGIRKKRADNLIRKISSRIANRIRSAVIRDNISDVGCSIRVFKRSCFDKIHFFRNAHRFFPALLIAAGYTVAETPVNHRPRKKGLSKYGQGISSRLFAGIVDLAGVYWLRKRSLIYSVHGEENN